MPVIVDVHSDAAKMVNGGSFSKVQKPAIQSG
jgi:hypothetical protein